MKILHVVFGVSALVLAVATFWLLAKDHNREWKKWQLRNRTKEAWALTAKLDALTDRYVLRLAQHESDRRSAQSKVVAPQLVEQLKSLVRSEDARLGALEAEFRPADFGDLDAAAQEQKTAARAVAEAVGVGHTQADDAIGARRQLFNAMGVFVAEAKRREKQLVVRKKFLNADRTAIVSELGLQVGGGASAEQQAQTQQRIDSLDEQLEQLTAKIADAKAYRTSLEAVQNEMDAEVAKLAKELDAMQAELDRLHEQVSLNTWNPGEWITRWPALDALYDGNVRINQIWLPDLTINYNFAQVARFDRCKTCHQAISKTAAGTTSAPAYPTIAEEDREIVIPLDTPSSQPGKEADLKSVYGIVLAAEGVIDFEAVTVHYVVPESVAARAGVKSGDIIRSIGDAQIVEKEQVAGLLLRAYPRTSLEASSGRESSDDQPVLGRAVNHVAWGEPIALTIERGLDHPFTSHPRLDLYLTDLSPHPEKVFGCTICHDGQGSGTEFRWTSHAPDNATQQRQWGRKYGWFDNRHWIFPMKPLRFVESNCTKCHYSKADFQASERFPDPSAPKLVEGWTLVEQYGCFGCHEIDGYDGPSKRVGPDLRLEPNYHETAAQILRDGGLNETERGWAEQLIAAPESTSARHRLLAALEHDAKLASSGDMESEARLSSDTHRLAVGLKDVEIAGEYRKVGPSLRYLQSKVDYDWLFTWISRPVDFRPTTRMPQFFHQFEHLEEEPDQLALSEKFESIEVRAITEFLLANSSEFQYLTPPAEVTETPSAERGKWLFESRGCLACHSHQDFSGVPAKRGPDLSRLGAKLGGVKGQQWLYSWIKRPHRYHARTKMPELYLNPIAEKNATGNATGRVTDPAADIVAYLLSIPTDWRPVGVPSREMTPAEVDALAALALQWLASDRIPTERAKKYLHEGIPAHLSPKLKAAERLLIGINDENRVAKQLEYVARQTIGKYGCFGCHDIPGFEDARPIGTALADWGRKEASKLAFGNIQKFIETHGIEIDKPENESRDNHAGDGEHVGHGHLDPIDFGDDDSYFIQSISGHSRDGFIWQKLRMPRSYDYRTTKNKGYNKRLQMPRFPLNDQQREAIITFVLGLVSEPPADEFIYHPDERQRAIVQGREVLDKFNCAGCHTMKMEQWQLAVGEGDFESPAEVVDFPFLAKHFSDKQIADSTKRDSRGKTHATLHGLTVMDEESGQPMRVDEDGLPLEEDDDESDPYYRFTLWRDALVVGETWRVGVQDLLVPADRDSYGPADGTAYPAWGGDLARYLFPRVIEHTKLTNPQAKGAEAWGWLPPSLMDEGDKVQPDWLHGFLMDPFPIRPAVVMRMPNFHMDSSDATKLVNFFAASSGAEYPYQFKRQRRGSYLAAQETLLPEFLSDAMSVVTNGNYCVKCHSVADFAPKGEPTTLGPNLADVYRRLRPEYVRKWVANPKGALPYTGMPINIPYKPDAPHLGGISQALFPGTSIRQVDGLVDLLMNFDIYAKRRTSIEPLVNSPVESSTGEQQE